MTVGEYLLTWVTSFAVIVAAITFLVKKLAEYFFARSAKAHEIALSTEAQHQMELFRASLQAEAVEHSVMFSRLHEKRSELVAELYRLILLAHKNARLYLRVLKHPTNAKEREAIWEAAFDSVNKLNEFFVTHRIYFSRDLCNRIDPLETTLRDSAFGFRREDLYTSLIVGREKIGPEDEARWDQFDSMIGGLLAPVEEEFRQLLGVSEARRTSR